MGSGNTVIYENHDTIKTSGPMDKFGNKSCSHWTFESDVTLLDKSQSNPMYTYTSPMASGMESYLAWHVSGFPMESLALTDVKGKKTMRRYVVGVGRFGSVTFNGVNTYGMVFPLRINWKMNGKDLEINFSLKMFSSSWKFWGLTYLSLWNHPGTGKGRKKCLSSSQGVDWQNKTVITDYLSDDPVIYSSTAENAWYVYSNKVYGTKGKVLPPFGEGGKYPVRRCKFNSDAIENLPRFGPDNEFIAKQWLSVTEDKATEMELDPIWSTLMVNALESFKVVDVNLLMSAMELVNMKGELTTWLEGLKSLPAVLKSENLSTLAKGKKASSAYLGYLYGYRLNIDEALDVGLSLASNLDTLAREYQRCIASDVFRLDDGVIPIIHNATSKWTYQARINSLPNAFSQMYVNLHRYSGIITLENAWDFIPFSFVLDWFFNFSKTFKAIDTYAQLQNYDLGTVIKSKKTECDIEMKAIWPQIEKYALNFPTSLMTVTNYNRWCSTSFEPVPLYPEVGSIPSILSKHWPEGLALIVQAK